jgi:hypothetical protein
MKIKNPIPESFDEKGKSKKMNNSINKSINLDSFIELYKSKNKITIHQIKKIINNK